MKIKMIVCDMDGTLLNSDGEISKKTRNILLKLQEKGIKVVLASGRGYFRLIKYAKELKLDEFEGYLIDVNGTSIINVQNKERERIGVLDETNIEEINNYFSTFNLELQYSQDDTIYTYLTDEIYEIKRNIRAEMNLPKDYPWMGGMYSWFSDTRDGYPNQYLIRNLQEAPKNCNKITLVQEPIYMNFISEIIQKSKLKEKYEFVFSDPRKIEITRRGINKGETLNILLEELGIQQNEVIVFGDSENDISMFKDKKYSVAMANSLQGAKHEAKYLTDSHNEEGIYNKLKQFHKDGLFS